MDPGSIDWQGLLKNPIVLGSAGGLVLLVVVVAIVKRRGDPKMKTKLIDPAIGRARTKLKTDLRMFREDVKKAAALGAPVFRKMDSEQAQAQAIGHWRKKLNHRITIRVPNIGALKSAARAANYDANPLSDLEISWKKMERQIQEYNSGRMDNDKTPIATIRQFEKDLDKIVILVNMCMTKYGG